MDKELYILFDLLVPTLGEYRKKGTEIRFNCPVCDEGGKHNLECNIEKKIFSCWACRLGGSIRQLFTKYCNIDSWKNFNYFKADYEHYFAEKQNEKKTYLPEDTMSYFRNEKVKKYLIEKRGIKPTLLKERKVKFVYDGLHKDSIYFPLYKDGVIYSGCLYNLITEKYKNLSSLDFIPYVEFIDNSYPITLTEGIVDCLSAINSIPCLGTKINKQILEYLYGKNVILAFDNKFNLEHYVKLLKQLEEANVNQLVIFDLHEYGDVNEFYLKDYENYIEEYKKCYKILLNEKTN